MLVLPVHIVSGGGPNLLGRDWLAYFDIDLSLLPLMGSWIVS